MPARPNKAPSLLPLERGGTGGRQAQISAFNESGALAPVTARFGAPEQIPGTGCRMFVWQRPDGDGVIAARLSGQDVKKGETGNGQVGALYDALVEAEAQQPRTIILTTDNSGYRDYSERPDLLLIEDLISEGWVRWVAWRNIDRIGREMLPIYTHLDVLKKAGVDLYLLREGGRKDLSRSDPSIHLAAIVANMEGENTHRRTHDALDRRWLEEGRGWPGFKPYATQRDDDTGFLVEDGQQLSHVRWLFERYAAAGEAMSLSRLARELWDERRVRMSSTTVNRLLRDPLYATGEWCVVYQGRIYAGRPIAWSQPVSMGLFGRVQQLLRLRAGRLSKTPEGEFALNGLLCHAPCMNERNAKGKLYRLRASRRSGREARYFHSPGAPDSDRCRGYSISRAVIEPVVMRELRRLAEDPELQKAWMQAAQLQRGRPATPVTPADVHSLERELADAERARDQLEEDTAQRLLRGQTAMDRYDRLAGRLEDQMVGLQSRLREARRDLEIAEAAAQQLPAVRDRRALLTLVQETLTDQVPDDASRREARAALVKSLLSAIVVHDTPEGLRLELQGWLVPRGAQLVDMPEVLDVAEGALRAAGQAIPEETAARGSVGAGVGNANQNNPNQSD